MDEVARSTKVRKLYGTTSVNVAGIRWKEYVHNWRGLAGEPTRQVVTTNCEKSADAIVPTGVDTSREGQNFS